MGRDRRGNEGKGPEGPGRRRIKGLESGGPELEEEEKEKGRH